MSETTDKLLEQILNTARDEEQKLKDQKAQEINSIKENAVGLNDKESTYIQRVMNEMRLSGIIPSSVTFSGADGKEYRKDISGHISHDSARILNEIVPASGATVELYTHDHRYIGDMDVNPAKGRGIEQTISGSEAISFSDSIPDSFKKEISDILGKVNKEELEANARELEREGLSEYRLNQETGKYEENPNYKGPKQFKIDDPKDFEHKGSSGPEM